MLKKIINGKVFPEGIVGGKMKIRLKGLYLVLLLTITCSALSPCIAYAQVDNPHNAIYVNNGSGNDDYDGFTPEKPKKTLQAALDAVPERGTVLLANGEYIAPLKWNREPFFTIDKDVAICGQDPSKTLIKPTQRIYAKWSDDENDVWVESAFRVDHGVNFILRNVTLDLSKAFLCDFVIDSNGKLDAENCKFTGRIRSAGGGNFKNCTFSSRNYYGSGIWNMNGRSNIMKCTFTGNENGNSGIINGKDALCTTSDCKFTKNQNDKLFVPDHGYNPLFGLFWDEGSPGVFSPIVNEGSCTVTNSMFINNTLREGGAIRNIEAGKITIKSCDFTGNVATGDKNDKMVSKGGSISNSGVMSVLNSNFVNNSARIVKGVSNSYGGAISNQKQATCRIFNCNFTGNSAYYGGAISNEDTSACEIAYNHLRDNPATYDAVYKSPRSQLSSGPNIMYDNADNDLGNHLIGDLDVSIESLEESAYLVKNYVEKYGQTPKNVEIGGVRLNMAQFLDLLTQELVKIKNNDRSALEVHDLNEPNDAQDDTHPGHISRDAYLKIAEDTQNCINTHNRPPGYSDKSGLGKHLGFHNLVYAYSILFDKIRTEHKLPDYIDLNRTITK